MSAAGYTHKTAYYGSSPEATNAETRGNVIFLLELSVNSVSLMSQALNMIYDGPPDPWQRRRLLFVGFTTK